LFQVERSVRLIGLMEEWVTFEELKADLLKDYEVNAKKSLRSVKLSSGHLTEFFGFDRALDITTDRIRAYISKRQDESASNATINRELAALKRMFPLAYRPVKSRPSPPYIPALRKITLARDFSTMVAF
jgi:site-specific recombinase XerD